MNLFDLTDLERQAYKAGRGENVAIDMEKVLELTAIAKRFSEQELEMTEIKKQIKEQDKYIDELENQLDWTDLSDLS